jgi:hypothetical protein
MKKYPQNTALKSENSGSDTGCVAFVKSFSSCSETQLHLEVKDSYYYTAWIYFEEEHNGHKTLRKTVMCY